jgi:hypothetical protein
MGMTFRGMCWKLPMMSTRGSTVVFPAAYGVLIKVRAVKPEATHYNEEVYERHRQCFYHPLCQIRRNTDRLQLLRMQVRDWEGDKFARRLEGYFRG